MKKQKNLYVVTAALIAAAYVVLTGVSVLLDLAYGPVQFRLSELLCVLPVLTPAAVPGLALGCLISNIPAPLGIADMVFGTLASVLAAIVTRALRNVRIKNIPVWSLLSPVLFNGLIVAAEITILSPAGFSLSAYLSVFLSVAAGEAAVVGVLGVPLLIFAEKRGVFSQK